MLWKYLNVGKMWKTFWGTYRDIETQTEFSTEDKATECYPSDFGEELDLPLTKKTKPVAKNKEPKVKLMRSKKEDLELPEGASPSTSKGKPKEYKPIDGELGIPHLLKGHWRRKEINSNGVPKYAKLCSFPLPTQENPENRCFQDRFRLFEKQYYCKFHLGIMQSKRANDETLKVEEVVEVVQGEDGVDSDE